MTLRDIFGPIIVTALLTAGSALAEPATVYFPSADGTRASSAISLCRRRRGRIRRW